MGISLFSVVGSILGSVYRLSRVLVLDTVDLGSDLGLELGSLNLGVILGSLSRDLVLDSVKRGSMLGSDLGSWFELDWHIVFRNFLHTVHDWSPGFSCVISFSLDVHCLMLLSPFAMDGSMKAPSAVHKSDILFTCR